MQSCPTAWNEHGRSLTYQAGVHKADDGVHCVLFNFALWLLFHLLIEQTIFQALSFPEIPTQERGQNMTGLWGLEEQPIMRAADSRPGALVEWRITGWRMRTKGFQPLTPAMLSHLRFLHILRLLNTPQTCLAN